MKPETLQHFSRQLHSWCAERLDQKPGPFRQAELQPALLGKKTALTPPIVLWVNRESCLAGGVILLPNREDQEFFSLGKDTARALGLPFFHSWGRHEISCWSSLQEQPLKVWEYDLPPDEKLTPANFSKCLTLLIDQIEQCFFDRQTEIPVTSELYLANLMHTTFIEMLPAMLKNMHLEQAATADTPFTSIKIRNFLFKHLMIPPGLALIRGPQSGTAPGTITDSLTAALSELPDNLQQVWASQSDDPEFPAACQRRLHHYYNRIQQLTNDLPEIMAGAVTRLLDEWAPSLGGSPLPAIKKDAELVVIHPDHCTPANAALIEIGLPGILAATALIRLSSPPGSDRKVQQYSDIFSLNEDLSGKQITGTLFFDQQPTKAEQHKLNAGLRVSWPNRRLTLPARTPFWVWEFLHLCGLLGEKSELSLILPDSWLSEHYGDVIYPVLTEKISFVQINAHDSGQLHCRINSAQEDAEPIIITHQNRDGSRTVQADATRSRILLTLEAPDEIYQLLDSGGLEFPQSAQFNDFEQDGLFNYSRSSLGHCVWKLLAAGKPLPKKDNIANAFARVGMPLPGKEAIAALNRLSRTGGSASTADIDQELSVWFKGTLPREFYDQRSNPVRKKTKTAAADDRLTELLEQCRSEEIPLFPEDYLYNTPLSARTQYTITGQLVISDSFFNQVVLGNQQQKITVEGLKQAEALVLISSFRSGTIELPQASRETEEMINRYRRDLNQLRERYARFSAEQLPDENINTTVDQIWQKLPLPKWNLVTNR